MAKETSELNRWLFLAVCLAPALAALVVYVWSIHSYGAGVSPDSIHYLTAARSVLAGDGFKTWYNAPLIDWPPATSAFLALTMMMGPSPLQAAALLHGAAYAGLAFFIAAVMTRGFHSELLRVMAGLTLCGSIALHQCFIMVWSEPLFVCFVTACLAALGGYVDSASWKWFALAIAAAALAALTRYAGVTVIAAGGLVLLLIPWKTAWRWRVARSAGFILCAGLPLGLWLVRNYSTAGTLTGERGESGTVLSENLRLLQSTVTDWFIPQGAPVWQVMLLNGAVLVIVVAAFLSRKHFSERVRATIVASLAFALVYTVFIVASATLVAFDAISDRLLAPLYVPLAFTAVAVIDAAANAAAIHYKQANAAAIGVAAVLVVALFGYPVFAVTKQVRVAAAYGVPGYSDRTWQESPTIAWLRDNSLDGRVYSNAADVLSLYAGTPEATMTPSTPRSIENFERHIDSDEAVYVIWFKRNINSWLPPIKRETLTKARLVADFPDGVIFTFPR